VAKALDPELGERDRPEPAVVDQDDIALGPRDVAGIDRGLT
jgi:hypothetical protein